MNSILIQYQPFTMAQKIYVFDKNGIELDVARVSMMDDVEKVAAAFATKYDVKKIVMVGGNSLLESFKSTLITKYGLTDIEYKLI